MSQSKARYLCKKLNICDPLFTLLGHKLEGSFIIGLKKEYAHEAKLDLLKYILLTSSIHSTQGEQAVSLPFYQGNVLYEKRRILGSAIKRCCFDDIRLCVPGVFDCYFDEAGFSKIRAVALFSEHCACEHHCDSDGFFTHRRVRLGTDTTAWRPQLPGKTNGMVILILVNM